MNFTTITSSEGRKNFPKIINEVDEQGKIYVVTVHGKTKVAIIDLDLLEEWIENTEYGISEKELLKRLKEKRIGFEELKTKFNVQS
ncbi:type II toxin-antitoxin system Phd/YefM family antitoxin [Candidatus Peregrinibacteria bacterium]|nr:type II toxin-antitoxin system Phd/YefM family antitoxin [Candidatus Peregrinibacteria bacterium]